MGGRSGEGRQGRKKSKVGRKNSFYAWEGSETERTKKPVRVAARAVSIIVSMAGEGWKSERGRYLFVLVHTLAGRRPSKPGRSPDLADPDPKMTKTVKSDYPNPSPAGDQANPAGWPDRSVADPGVPDPRTGVAPT